MMNKVKKTGILAGAVIGGAIGGTLSIIGKVSKNKFVDELGGNIVDSTILTGSIAGTVVSGASHIVSGKFNKNPLKMQEGTADLKYAGKQIIGNFVSNLKTVAHSSNDIVDGVKKRDKKKVIRSTKTLAKIIVVGAITVGAIQVEDAPKSETP